LFTWFKNFVGYKDGGTKDGQSVEIESEIVSQQQTKEKHEGMAMEIGDFLQMRRFCRLNDPLLINALSTY